MEYITAHKQEGHGRYNFGIEIKVASDTLPDLKQKEIYSAVYTAVDTIKAEIHAAMIKADPKTIDEINKNKKLINLFPGPIFVEEIPNGYCSDWCCRHLPWFIVTTSIGRIKIGWRKRVINIDWSDTVCHEYSAVLFSDEDTTTYDQYVHAWSMEKAGEYITRIIQSANKPSDL
jgi:hypothetical protein